MAKPKPKQRERPNLEVRKAQAELLSEMKPRVLGTSRMGDNHHDAIDAQIQVIEDNLSDDEIYNTNETEEWRENVLQAALDARRWLDGEYEEYPDIAASWKELER